jgi:phenylacetate-coenzyme A ligase PaaK-like adenylate-forming protein
MQATTSSPPTRLREDLQAGLQSGYDELIARLAWDRDRLLAHQRQRLRALLRSAVAGSSFHRDRLAGVDPAAVEPGDLTGLPVMTKADLMTHFDEVVTDPRVTLARAEAALAGAVEEPATLPGPVLALTSGGSSGPRGVFLLDLPATRQFIGSLSRGLVARLRGAGIAAEPLRIAMVAAASPVHATRAAVFLAGTELGFAFTPVPVTLPLPEIVARLEELRPEALYGYPTMLARLAREKQAGRLHIAPRMVNATSETLTAELRATIGAGFGVPVADTFGSTEGLVGVAAPDEDTFVFAEDGCIVEPVDHLDRPVPRGTPSAAVLITVLENHLQPLIRYRLPDSLTVRAAPATGLLRAGVEGRSDDVLRFGDRLLHPLVVRSVLVHVPEVVDYQVRQTTRGIAVSVLAPSGLDGPALSARLGTALAEAGLPGAEVCVRAVGALPRDERTGKLRRFVPLG